MRPATDADAEAWVLSTEPGLSLLAEVEAVPHPRPADLDRWRRIAPADRVSAAARLAECRRRGAAKFSRASSMWLEPTGLEQATAEPVARHKARRFAGARVVDLCSGIGGDALAMAADARVVAVDLDAGMGRRCLWNARVYGVADRLVAVRCPAERFPIPAGCLVHVDPDRRAGPSPRARSLRGYAPGPEFLVGLSRSARGGALKLGPASDFEAHLPPDAFEVELVSLNGECKEATLWFGELASAGLRRATILPGGATWTDLDGPAGPGPARTAAGVSAWAFSPDPSLVRVGLLDAFAAAHGLARVGPGIDVLTGPHRVSSPFLAPFAVDEVLPLDLKRLRREVSARRLGPLEIKVRGLDLRPEAVRARLRPEGPNPATLLLVAGRGPGLAILARRGD